MGFQKNFDRYYCRMLVSGNRHTINQMIIDSINSRIERCFPNIKPLPQRLPFTGKSVARYFEFITWASLKAYLLDPRVAYRLDVGKIIQAEDRYLASHPDISAKKWTRSKLDFSRQFREVTKGNYKAFYTKTKPFSTWAALWCFEDYINRFKGIPSDLQDSFADSESDYLESYDKNCSLRKWDKSKEAFLQCLDQSSLAFDRFRLDVWDAVSDAEGIHQKFIHDNSVVVTFFSLGGPARKIVKALSEMYPELTFVHSWVNTNDSTEKGCKMYSQS